MANITFTCLLFGLAIAEGSAKTKRGASEALAAVGVAFGVLAAGAAAVFALARYTEEQPKKKTVDAEAGRSPSVAQPKPSATASSLEALKAEPKLSTPIQEVVVENASVEKEKVIGEGSGNETTVHVDETLDSKAAHPNQTAHTSPHKNEAKHKNSKTQKFSTGSHSYVPPLHNPPYLDVKSARPATRK